MPNGSDRVTSHPLQELQPTKSVDDPEIKAWLALGTKTKKKGGGRKKKKGKKTKGLFGKAQNQFWFTTVVLLIQEFCTGLFICMGPRVYWESIKLGHVQFLLVRANVMLV